MVQAMWPERGSGLLPDPASWFPLFRWKGWKECSPNPHMHPKHFKFCNSEGGGIWGNVESDPLVVPRAQGRSLGFLRYPRATPLAGRCRRGNTGILTERWQSTLWQKHLYLTKYLTSPTFWSVKGLVADSRSGRCCFWAEAWKSFPAPTQN